MNYCIAGHVTGSSPHIVPVAGERGLYVVYHGMNYLSKGGSVQITPEHMNYSDATKAIIRHEMTLAPVLPDNAVSYVVRNGAFVFFDEAGVEVGV